MLLRSAGSRHGRAERDEVAVGIPDYEGHLSPRLGAQALVCRRAAVSQLEEERLGVVDLSSRAARSSSSAGARAARVAWLAVGSAWAQRSSEARGLADERAVGARAAAVPRVGAIAAAVETRPAPRPAAAFG